MASPAVEIELGDASYRGGCRVKLGDTGHGARSQGARWDLVGDLDLRDPADHGARGCRPAWRGGAAARELEDASLRGARGRCPLWRVGWRPVQGRRSALEGGGLAEAGRRWPGRGGDGGRVDWIGAGFRVSGLPVSFYTLSTPGLQDDFSSKGR
jgi:hypothetical protein